METSDVLLTPGDKEGATKIVAEPGGGAALYEWSGEGGWAKVGDVVAGPGGDDAGAAPAAAGPAKKWHAGAAWDFVFDVDVADGAPPLRLPYNRGENPYTAADRFLAAEGLPQSYREQVVAHILACTAGTAAAFGDPLASNVDPFTGGGAYIPGSGGGGSVGGGGGAGPPAGGSADPFTGGGAYVPGTGAVMGGAAAAAPAAPAAAGFELTGGGADPFTGGGAAAAAAAPPPRPAFTLFDAPPARPAALAAKLAALLAEAGAASLVEGCDLDALAAVAAAAAGGGGPAPPAPVLATLTSLLASAPPAALFPVLDLARCVSLHPAGADALAASGAALGRALTSAVAGPAPPPAAVLVAARAAANTARHARLRAWAASQAGPLCEALAGPAGGAGAAPAAKAAWGAALGNLALAVEEAGGSEGRAAAAVALASAAVALAASSPSDPPLAEAAVNAAAACVRACPAVRAGAVEIGLGGLVEAGRAAGVGVGGLEAALKG